LQSFLLRIQLNLQTVDLGSKAFFHLLAFRLFIAAGLFCVLELGLQPRDVFPEILDDLLSFFFNHLFMELYGRLQSGDFLLKLVYFLV
jgi:hypothetical protein